LNENANSDALVCQSMGSGKTAIMIIVGLDDLTTVNLWVTARTSLGKELVTHLNCCGAKLQLPPPTTMPML